MVLDTSDYERIIQSTKFLSMEDKKQLEKERKERQNANLEASLQRKKEMQEFEFERKKNERPSDIAQVGVSLCETPSM